MNSLKLAVVQFTPVFKKKDENLSKIRERIKDLDADIIVLPELCTTGYLFFAKNETAELAETVSGPTCAFFRDMANITGAIIIAGFIEQHGKNIFNSALMVQPGKPKIHVYRKTHLFYKEPFCFDPGNSGFFVIHDADRDIRIGLMICYDWRFPESARVLSLLGADLIVCPSNLVTEAWRTVIPARAIENKVYMAVANRAGTEKRNEDELVFKGNSAIYDFTGKMLQSAGSTEDEIRIAPIFPELTRDKAFNELNDVFKDRRPKYYKPLV